ncbi:helix-turn-helix domain-containing protein [Bacillus thuringiensis]|uniref:helix-turn-helix domain-containing protein n=1 Tax=Bacillus thuringiensis TaxID=1428 RepID=UPI00211D6840|nr:helix-turn-helix domain-containing protein [Bacillus thuringiensis]
MSTKSKGYMLIKPLNENLNLVLQSYLKENVIYKIIIALFNGKHYSLEKWAQILYVNKVTLKNILKKFNMFLEKGGIKLKFRVLKLDGEEINIRYFYIAFFYLIKNYGININSRCPFKKVIENIVKSYGVKINLNLLTSIFIVCINRNLRKNNIKQKIEINSILDYKQS